MRRSVTLAREAADAAAEAEDGAPRLVAASVGPYGAVLADGSEYRGDYGVSTAALRRFHRRARGAGVGRRGPARRGDGALRAGGDGAARPAVGRPRCPPGCRSPAPTATTTRRGRAGRRGCSGSPAGTTGWSRSASTAPRRSTSTRWCGRQRPRPAASRRWPTRTAASAGTAPRGAWGGDGAGVDVDAAREWVGAGARYVGGCCRVGSADIARLAPGRSARPDRLRTSRPAGAPSWCVSPTVGVTARSSPSGVETQTRNSYGFLISPIAWPVQRAE